MSVEDSEFEALMRRVAGGAETAVWELLERYSRNILRTVRRRLPAEIRSKVDSSDIVQSVWKSLLRKGQRLDAFATSDQLIAYIASMARLKVYETHRHFTRKERLDVRREVSGADPTARQRNQHREFPPDPIDRRTDTPSAIVQAQESWENALRRNGARTEQIIQLKIQGATTEEIAERLGLCKRTVQRHLLTMLHSLEA